MSLYIGGVSSLEKPQSCSLALPPWCLQRRVWLFKMLLIKYLYVKTFFSIPCNEFCQIRDTKGNSRDSKLPHAGLTHRARAETPQSLSIFQVLLDFHLCSSLFLLPVLIPLPPASLSQHVVFKFGPFTVQRCGLVCLHGLKRSLHSESSNSL